MTAKKVSTNNSKFYNNCLNSRAFIGLGLWSMRVLKSRLALIEDLFSLTNRQLKFIPWLDSVPENPISADQGINEGLNLIHLIGEKS